jgi:hypothetical protein
MFKPNKTKIFTTIAIALLNIITGFYAISPQLCSAICPPATPLQELLTPSIYPLYIPHYIGIFLEKILFLPSVLETPISLILGWMIIIGIWYLIACIIVKLIKKIKPRKN